MKKLLSTFAVLSVLFFSCSKNNTNDAINATLTLSENGVISVSSEASQKNISISTNQSTWSSFVNDSWITLTESGSTLSIDIKANDQAEPRHADILVIAGGKAETITIKQSSNGANIEIMPYKLNANYWEDSYTVDIKANTSEWSIEPIKETWLKLIAKPKQKEIIVFVEENTNTEKRDAVVTIKDASGKTTDFTVTQEGALYYILPCLDVNANTGTIDDFEKARKSTLVIDAQYVKSSANPVYKTKSKAFPEIQYFTIGKSIVQVVATAKDESALDNKFIKLLTDNGFKKVDSDYTYSKRVTDNFGRGYEITAYITVSGSYSVLYDFVPEQTEEQPSFKDGLPYGFSDFKNCSIEKIKTWEKNAGGVLNMGIDRTMVEDGFYWFDYPSKPESLVTRMYYVNTATEAFEECTACFADISKFFYVNNGAYYMTREFTTLLNNEGYEFSYVDGDNYQFFYSSRKNLFVGIKITRYEDTNNNELVVDFRYYPDGDSSTSAKACNKIDSKLPVNMLKPTRFVLEK